MVPFFSIVVPVYNCEKYLKQGIESVLKQTYQSWELILIDDGSTDMSGEICDNFVADSRVKVVHQKNGGELVARSKGLLLATGTYVICLDADDFFDIDCLEVVKRAIEISESDLIFFGLRYVGARQGDFRSTLRPENIYSQKTILKEIIETTNSSLCNKAIRRTKIENESMAEFNKSNKRLSISADYMQIINILCNVDTAYILDDILYNYCIHEKSLSQSVSIENIFDEEYVVEYVIEQLKKHSLLDEEIQKIIHVDYLKVICSKLERLFMKGGIKRSDCEKIHASQVYIQSEEEETIQNLGRNNFAVLNAFRHKRYYLILCLIRKRQVYRSLGRCRRFLRRLLRGKDKDE